MTNPADRRAQRRAKVAAAIAAVSPCPAEWTDSDDNAHLCYLLGAPGHRHVCSCGAFAPERARQAVTPDELYAAQQGAIAAGAFDASAPDTESTVLPERPADVLTNAEQLALPDGCRCGYALSTRDGLWHLISRDRCAPRRRIMTGPVGMARALLGRWQAQLDLLYDAALAEPDAAARDRLLIQAAAIEACDMDVRRAAREAVSVPDG